jgi:putative ABC transport system permease protein
MLADLKSRLASLFRRNRVEDELDAELRFHFDKHVAKLEASGLSHQDALRQTRLEFGTNDSVKEEHRDARGVRPLENFAQDVAYGLRILRKSPGYAIIAILTLALGIGANAAIFSYIEAWVIKPLPYPQAQQLMVIQSHNTKQGWTSWQVSSTADYLDFEKQSTSFEQLAMWNAWQYNLTGDGRPDRVDGGLVGWNFFQTLGVQPIMGRAFIEQEGQPANSHVAIISRGLWQSRFAGDPKIIGREINLQGETYTVVGVMPANFQFPIMGIANIWTPLALDDKGRADRDTSWFCALGRLKPGVTAQQAAAEALAFSQRQEKLYPKSNTDLVLQIRSLSDRVGENEGTPQLEIAFWVVGLVLLIACANVANLMLARASRRAKEFAVRGALGATRGRLIRQLLTESALLFLVGGAAGAIVAHTILKTIDRGFPEKIRGYLINYGHVDLDVNALLYTFGIAALCGVVFGLVPAFQSSGLDVGRTLKEASGQLAGNRRVARTRRIFVGAQIALAVVVMICTALLVESFAHMTFDRMGFNPTNLEVTQLVLPKSRYAADSDTLSFYDRALARIQALPEVSGAAAGQYIPFGDANQMKAIHVAGRPPAQPGEGVSAVYSAITPSYLSTMQIGLLRGRGIESSDGSAAPKVILINETVAREDFHDENPIGQVLEIGEEKEAFTIVGVVSDVKRWALSDSPERQIYVPFAQAPSGYMSIVVRSDRDAPTLPTAIRDAIWSVDSDQPVSLVRPIDDLISEENTGYRTLSTLFAFFGLLALLLGAIGIYGVMASAVEQRLHEIGIRMALGATPTSVIRMMLRFGLTIAAIGVTIGLVMAAAASKGLTSLLYKVNALDPVAFIGVGVLFALVTGLACYIPARRGARVDPMVALRCE